MHHKNLIFGIVFLLFISFVSATDFTEDNKLYYSLDNTSYIGSTIIDLSENYNGTNNGATTNVSGHLLDAFSFDGTNDYIATPFSDLGSAYTVSLWVKVDSYYDYGGIIGGYEGGVEGGIIFYVYVDGISFYHSTTGNWNVFDYVTSDTTNWIHLVQTYDGTRLINYVDNTIVRNISMTSFIQAPHNYNIGKDGVESNFFNGKVDEIGTWNRTFTPTQISELYNLTHNPYLTIFGIENISLTTENITYSTQDLHCNFTVYDSINETLNATVNWYVNNTLNNTYQYTFIDLNNTVNNVTTITTAGTGSFTGTIYNNTNYSCTVNVTEGENNIYLNSTGVVSNIEDLTVVINYPIAGTHYNNSNLEINYSVINYTEIDSCWWTKDLGVTNNSITCNNNITGQTWLEGNNTVTIYSNSTGGYKKSDSVIFYIDITLPTITINSPNADNTSFYLNVTNVFFNISLYDLNLYGHNLTCTNSLGDVVFSNQLIDINETSYNYTASHLFTETGLIMCKELASDDHTDKDWAVNITEDKKWILFGKVDNLNINKDIEIDFIEDDETKIEYISYEKKFDRVSPIIKVAKETIYEKKGILFPEWIEKDIKTVKLQWRVKYKGTAYKRDSEYKGHVIIHPDNKLENAYWVDGENNCGSNVTTEIFDDYVLYTTLVSVDKLKQKDLIYKTDSIGGLNFFSKNFSFLIKSGQNVSFNGYNSWDSSNIKTNLTVFNGTVTNYYYDINNETISIGCEETTIIQNSNNYMNSQTTILENCDDSSSYNLPFWQSETTVNVRNIWSNDILTNSYITVNDSITNNSLAVLGYLKYYLNADTYSINASKSPYNASNITEHTFTLGSVNTVNKYLSPTYNIHFVREETGLDFNFSETNETNYTVYLDFYCPTRRERYIITEPYVDITPTCNYAYWYITVTSSSNSYFRTLVPDKNEFYHTVYLLDYKVDTMVQIIFNLKDLIGEYNGGYITAKNFVNNTKQTVIKQLVDIENKVIFWLDENEQYEICVETDGDVETCLGNIIADAAGTKTISLPNLQLYPSNESTKVTTNVWANRTENKVHLDIWDSSNYGWTNATWKIYNGTNLSASPLQTLTSTSGGNVTLTAIGITRDMTLSHTIEIITVNPLESVNLFGLLQQGVIGLFPGFSDSFSDQLKLWVAIIIPILIAMAATISTATWMSIITIIMMWLFKFLGWFYLIEKTTFGFERIFILLILCTVILGFQMFNKYRGKRN